MKPEPPQGLSLILCIIFGVAVIMATGPGILLVNRPEQVLGIPLVYAWGILWYFVIVAVAGVAYVRLWHDDEEEGGA